jgi:hypothetical protein
MTEPRTVVIPMTCGYCREAIEIECDAGLGFGHMHHYSEPCPACDRFLHPELPGAIRDTRIAHPA